MNMTFTDFALIILLPTATAILIQWLTQHSPLTPQISEYMGVSPPFFVVGAVLFGLFANFLLNDVWVRATEHKDALEQSFEREAGALHSIRSLAVGLGQSGDAVKDAVDDYTSLSLRKAGAAGNQPDAVVEEKLQQFVSAVLALPLEQTSANAAQTVMLQSFRQLELARAERKSITVYRPDPYKWLTAIALGILTQLSLALVHLDKRKAQAAALSIFTLTFILVLVVIRISEIEITRIGQQHQDFEASALLQTQPPSRAL